VGARRASIALRAPRADGNAILYAGRTWSNPLTVSSTRLLDPSWEGSLRAARGRDGRIGAALISAMLFGVGLHGKACAERPPIAIARMRSS